MVSSLRFLAAISLGAFLLFQCQPILGRFILPWFGGGASIWATCMLFFQFGLLAGYYYAHLLTNYLGRRTQAWTHFALLVASLSCLPNPTATRPAAADEPIAGILVFLLINVGLPFVLLSATGPVLQTWFSQTNPDKSPYRLYALSNAASLTALLAYPFLVEPFVTLARQLALWKWAYAAFIGISGWCAIRYAGATSSSVREETSADAARSDQAMSTHVQAAERGPSTGTRLIWLALSACGSAMLLATTNQLCREVPVVPFLWILPLVVYLVSFVITFDSPDGTIEGPSGCCYGLWCLGHAWRCMWVSVYRLCCRFPYTRSPYSLAA